MKPWLKPFLGDTLCSYSAIILCLQYIRTEVYKKGTRQRLATTTVDSVKRKKVMSDRPGLLDFGFELVDSHWPDSK